ncbi:Gfo/Idh/MocA family oxidoreductase [bacterium]|nr:Gfo/Idh/MocA family oxidoreductase [bacterium]
MTNKKILNWGLIGCGDISRRRVAPALCDLNTCRLVAVSRADSSQLDNFALEFGAEKMYTQWTGLVADPEIEAVYIATPVHLHAVMAVEAARAGKHVICEKPMAMTDTECQDMINACQQNHVRLGIAYYRHHYPVIQRIKKIIEESRIGDVKLVQMNAFSSFNRKPGEPRCWLLEKDKSGGGPMMDFGCHRIEVMLNIFGKIETVYANTSNLRYKRNVEDTAIAYFGFPCGARGSLTVTHTVFESQDTLDIFGTQGSVHVPVLNQGTLVLTTETGKTVEKWPPHDNLHLPLIDDFTQSVLYNRLPAVTGETGLAVNQILTKIYANSF